jgi:ribosomal protein S18 acetylase RimI-like enzyme
LEALKEEPLAFGGSYKEESDFSDKVWKERIHNTLFAILDDEPVGMIGFLLNQKNKLAHVAEIFGVYVKEDFRNSNIGGNLVEAAIKSIRENKSVIKIKLTVTSVQDPAIKLYSSFGFEIVGKLKKELKYEEKFYDAIIMEKIL